MKRTYTLLAAVLAIVASAVTVAAAGAHGAAATAHASRVAKITLRHTSLGTILTTSSGFTLYEFTRDHGAQNSCMKLSGCPATWPALQTSGTPTAGPGVHSSLLSSIRLSGSSKQVTYAGHPLYLYSGDSGPAETSYVGARAFGGSWYAINASGHTVK
jgi:predicted lipoprotein with Yx(FWY)xxD motif